MREMAAPHCSNASFAVNATLFGKNAKFLIDTGADVSVLPPQYKNKAFPFDIELKAANSSVVKTHGCVATEITIANLKRNYYVRFIVADVVVPILGADFFREHGLLIDVAKQCLIDPKTDMAVNLLLQQSCIESLNLVTKIDDTLMRVLERNANVFDIHADRPTPKVTFAIESTSTPRPATPYRLSPDKVRAAKAEIDKEMKLGRMVRSSSSYASPFFPVKKPDGTWRFVADYTRLNNVTVKDNYIPPRIEDLLSRIPQGCVFSKLDLQKAFFLIPIDPKDQHKTAVCTPFGLYEYTVMPMGLKNASQTLQRYIDTVLSDNDNTIAYCDDILLFSKRNDHLAALDGLLKKLHEAGLVVNRQKSLFLQDSVNFLGHHFTTNGVLPSPEKQQGLQAYTVPSSVKQVRRFLGMVNFYRKFMPNAAEIQAPLTALTQKDVKFAWTDNCQNAFDALIKLVSEATELVYPTEHDQYVLTTDASSIAVGAVLSSQNGPIGFYSQKFTKAELNYSTYDKELTAVFKAVKHFEWLLFGRSFHLRVDHKPLIYLFSKEPSLERRRRQVEYLSTFDIKIEHIPGRENIVADTLSRDAIVDAIHISPPLQSKSLHEIRELQEADDDFRQIPPSLRCDTSGIWRTQQGQILVPQQFRQSIVSAVHSTSHSGFKSTLRQIQLSYSWPGIRKEVQAFVKQCVGCQSSKIVKHTKPPYKDLGTHPPFTALHIDFVGPLPQNKGKTHLCTIFDRGTRFFYAYPVSHTTAEAATSCVLNWVSIFGVPEYIISDRGASFESRLFQEMATKLGINKHRTTAYHPSANGGVERQHRRLKEALKAKSADARSNWLVHLPLILLGLNNSISEDTGLSAAQAAFRQQMSVPGCLFENITDITQPRVPERNYQRHDTYIPTELRTCEFVWVRRGPQTKSLQRPYTGPYKVISRNLESNTMCVEMGSNNETISLERLKPAFLLALDSTPKTSRKKRVSFANDSDSNSSST